MKTGYLPALALVCLLGACTNGEEPAEATERQDEAASAAADATASGEAPVTMPRSASADGARVFFISPTDGETVSNPVKVVFGIEGMSVVPAGDNTPHSGHHHLLIDTGLPEFGLPIPKDDNHVHFGSGATETEISLESGEHTLQMLLGDHLHIPHEPPLMSDQITIRVE